MLSNTLSSIEIVLQKQLQIDKDKTSKICEFFKHYTKNMWIYPGTLKRKFSLDMQSVYILLDELSRQGILSRYFQLYCNYCQKPIGLVKNFNELPDTFTCEQCDRELLSIEHSIVIYKVVRDD